MTLGELKERIEDLLDSGDATEESEVLLMTQENYPFENAVVGVCTRQDIEDEDDDEEDGDSQDVFIVEGRQLRYGSKAAWEVAQ